MSWKYKHFQQTRLFAADRDVVWDAARTFMTQSLGWQITGEMSEGFTAEGYSFAHQAIADVRIQSAADGTSVGVELSVERAGSTGFMLFDVGGYYNIQIRHWLDGIQGLIHQKLTDSQGAATIPAPPPPNKTTACLFNGCLAFIFVVFGLWFLADLVLAVVGLITGHLIILGQRNNIHLYGVWGRAVSALILLFATYVLWWIMKKRRSSRRNV